MLYLIGLGLGDVRDISVRGLEIVRACDKVYLEAYTSILPHGPSKEELEQFYGRPVELADRETVEQSADNLLQLAAEGDVALLVVGDPFGATTHSDLVPVPYPVKDPVFYGVWDRPPALRAAERKVPVETLHNASIMNAVGCTGLQLYRFGEAVSLVMWEGDSKVTSYYDKIAANYERGLHTLCLLDIKVKEQSIENLIRGRKVYEPPRYMSASEAAQQLIEIAEIRRQDSLQCPVTQSTECVAVARLGWPSQQRIVSGSLSQLARVDMGPPLHSLIVCGTLHPCEKDMLRLWRVRDEVS